jgi:probable F420-dependent oxidoreductase
MHIGVYIFATDYTLQPIDLALAAEERGFESIFLPEHSHIPTSRTTPWGGAPGAPPLPEMYWHTHDTIVALSAMAAVTDRLKVGTGISLVAQHDAIWLAKQVASLDVISAGRMLFGVGFGWNVEEMIHHGVDPRSRRRLVAEKVRVMKALWTEEEAAFEGEFLNLEPSWSWPKPVQKPHPPIILGAAAGPKNFDALFDFADGWIPFGRTFEVSHAMYLSECERRDRDPAGIEISVWDPRQTPEALDDLRRKGIARAVFRLPSGTPDEVITAMDGVAKLL